MFRIACMVFALTPIFALDSFSLHNISDAHNLGYTGKGVKIGIADTKFNPNHYLLSGQFFHIDKNDHNPDYDKDKSAHGTNVAGVAAANRTDGKYYGVAYNAKMAGFGEFGDSIRSSWGEFVLNSDIRIINHSWGYTFTTDYSKEQDRELEDLASNHKVLMVFASGNESDTHPHFPANNPRYNEKLQSWLAVGNLNANHISRDNSGRLIVASRGISYSSNLCINSSRFCVMASGTDITTADANNNNGLVSVSGTSFAAPLTSGVAALVAEKFPFMDGKQLADTILSTANSDFQAPKMVLASKAEYYVGTTDNIKFKDGGTIIYIDNNIPSDKNQIMQDIIDAYGTINADYKYKNITTATKEEVFGQGIVDAKKALGGIALIDINRLSDSDVQKYQSETQAFYTIDTKGFSGVFSNDIGQRKWDEKYHDSTAINKSTKLSNLDAGLIKKGTGTLTITGDLNYLGATIIQGGNLSLAQGKATPLSVKGSVYVENGGNFSAFGKVALDKNLNNSGVVSLNSDSALKIKGKYTQEGTQSSLFIGFTQSDINNNRTALNSASYDIKGGKLIYAPKIASYKNENYKVPLQDLLLNQVDKFSNVELANISNVLNYKVSSDKKQITATTKSDAYENFDGATASDKLMAKALRNIASQNLSAESTIFFEELNIAPKNVYGGTIQSMDNNAHLSQSAQILRIQNNNNIRQILHSQSIMKNSATFTLTPYYSYTFGAESTAHFVGSHLAFDKAFENITIGGFFSYGNHNSAFHNAKFNTHSLQGSANIIGDIASVKLIANASIGGAFNTMERTIGAQSTERNLKGKYNDLIVGANAGVGYDIKISHTTLTPQAILSYGFIKRGAFAESSKVDAVAMKYDSLTHNALSALVGVNWNHKFLANQSLLFGIYGFYERNILGANINGGSRFEGDNTPIAQTYAMPKDSGLFGVTIGYNGDRGFVNFSVDSAVDSAKKVSIGAIVEGGFKFGGGKKRIIKKIKKIPLDSTKRQKMQDSQKSQNLSKSQNPPRLQNPQNLSKSQNPQNPTPPKITRTQSKRN